VRVDLGRGLPPPHLGNADHLLDEPVQATAVQERLGSLPRPVAQAHHRHSGIGQDLHRRLGVGLGGERGESVQDMPDGVIVEPATADHPQRRCGHGRERLVAAGKGQRHAITQRPVEPSLQGCGVQSNLDEPLAQRFQGDQCLDDVEGDGVRAVRCHGVLLTRKLQGSGRLCHRVVGWQDRTVIATLLAAPVPSVYR